MKSVPVALPAFCAQRVGAELAARVVGGGETALLDEPLIGLIASRECPGHVLLETLERVPEWVKAGRVTVSGFHSPLEQQVRRSVLRRGGRVEMVLGRGMTRYNPLSEEGEAIAAGRFLVISANTVDVRRTTRVTPLQRNQLVIALAAELVVPYLSEGSPLSTLVSASKKYGQE
jgi:predicted Rossmann fold nucleotide-binding protein DprA/Smf involved in DNA uptake